MQINIQGVGLDLTEALKQYVNEKFKKLERKGDIITTIAVTLTLDNNPLKSHVAKADLSVSGGNLHTEEAAETMYAAIDGLIDKVDRQLVRYKEKQRKD